MSMEEVLRKEVEVVHPWPEWIELMERLAQQNYFDLSRVEEDRVAAEVPIDLSDVIEEVGLDFSRDYITVKNACMNFGRDRFDILKSLSRKDLQILVGHGCPSMDPKVVFSSKLLRKLVHLDEGDVCSSCSLRNSCSRGYILTRKEDEARTLDVIRILLTYGFDHVKGTVENKALLKLKSVKTVVRKLIHEIVKLSAVPIDPNLPPPVIKKPPPKVKQPPPQPKKRVGRDDVEMKKGDWLCPKCDFMNFAKNTVCLQCDAKRPKRQLLPGEWECPRCNFLNYRRNMACFQCEHKRPPDEYTENQLQAKQSAPRTRLERPTRLLDVSNAWNFDFDDNESDGADVAAFEFADSPRISDNSLDNMPFRGIARNSEDDVFDTEKTRTRERERNFSEGDIRRDSLQSSRTGFDDFDDEEVDDLDSYELDMSKGGQTSGVSRTSFSELEMTSEEEDFSELDCHRNSRQRAKDYSTGAGDDDLDDHPSLKSSHLADSWQKTGGRSGPKKYMGASFGSDSEDGLLSDLDGDIDDTFGTKQRSTRGNPGRAAIRLRRDSYSEDESLPGMVSDDDNYLTSDDRRREKSSANFGDDDFPARGSRSNRRNSRGGRHGGSKLNDRFRSFDMLDGEQPSDRQRRRGNQLADRSRGLRRNGKGTHRDDYGRWNDGGSPWATPSSGRERFGNNRWQRGNDNFTNRFDEFDVGSDRPRRCRNAR